VFTSPQVLPVRTQDRNWGNIRGNRAEGRNEKIFAECDWSRGHSSDPVGQRVTKSGTHTVAKAGKCLISGVLLGRSVWSPDKTLCEGWMHYSVASRIHPTNTRHVCCPVCLTWRCLCWIISRFFVKVRIKMLRCLPWQCVGVSTVCGTLPLRRLASSQAPLSADTSLRLWSSFYKLLGCRVVYVRPYNLTAFLPLYPFATFAPVSYAILVCPL